jgi:ribonucleoside-diphosphate reductase alpha chain
MTATLDAPIAAPPRQTVKRASRSARRGFMHNTKKVPAAERMRQARVFTVEGIHPYDQVTWERRDVVMSNWRDGKVNFEQKDVEFPDFWSVNATNIVVSKYFRGQKDTPQRESSLRQLIDRVVGKYVAAAKKNHYFATPQDLKIWEHELTYMLLHQIFSFNSPVWFNVGWTGREQQVSACFILAVSDTMDSILDWYREEGLIFKGGSGAGVSLSGIRGSTEVLRSSGGEASGPISFMRGADASAGAIKSGGATRRAAKMVILDVDHPDIEEFIELKMNEEKKIRVLRDNGFDMDLGGKDMPSVQYQNANNSVRVSDEFLKAVEAGEPWDLINRLDGSVAKTVDARELWQKIAVAAHACADPGVQYDSTIQHWHTCPESGRISASNPCSEYLHLDNSSCNLASINLLKFLGENGVFDAELFAKVVEVVITAMDVSICFADFPTEKIRDTTHRFRQLGIGYANLGALLMAMGHPYDSDSGRNIAAVITSLMQATAYHRSAELAGVVGAYEGYAKNAADHTRVIKQHIAANDGLLAMGADDEHVLALATQRWAQCLERGLENGWRNAQASVIAPTGTISFMMDVDTTGLEPDLALIKLKKLVGGGSMQIENQGVPRALKKLGYTGEVIDAVVEHVKENGHVVDAPGLDPAHYPVFDCSMGKRPISWKGHVLMMAAVQPFISGGISKTVNLPGTATAEDVSEAYMLGWKLGLKAIAVYVDESKVGQPLSDAKGTKAAANIPKPVRRRLPKDRPARTISFNIAGAEGYMTTGEYVDEAGKSTGELGEVFIKMSKQGSTLSGVMDAFSVSTSIALQYGVPLETFVQKFTNMRFEPLGMTEDEDIRIANSVMDYLFRKLALIYLPAEIRQGMGISSATERAAELQQGKYEAAAPEDRDVVAKLAGAEKAESEPIVAKAAPGQATLVLFDENAPICTNCGTHMQRAGSCYACTSCGSTSGCS